MTPKLLYVGAKYDYGDKTRGLSFENRNFHHPLQTWCAQQGWDFVPYDFYTRGQEIGQDAMTQELRELARREKPAFLFSVLVDHPLDPRHEVFSQIGQTGETITLHWFCDDHWRWENYSQFVAPHFHFVMTTADSALPKYAQVGLGDRVIKTQWACNHELYTPTDAPRDIDVSFVGMPHGDRVPFLNALAERGLSVEVFGHGWQGRPRLPFHQMVRLFSRSKINLNLSNASVMTGQQIKGRNFEIPGAGGFLLTGKAGGVGEYYTDDQEVVTFDGADDLAEKARFYLAHEDERTRIAENGRRRTLAEHTWHHRFNQIFQTVGQRLASPAPQTQLRRQSLDPLPIQGTRGFNFLSMLDWAPSGGWKTLVWAYVEEFGADENVALILRPSSAEGQTVEAMAAEMDAFIENDLRQSPEHTPDIIFEVSPLPDGDLPRLYRTADAFVLPTAGAASRPEWRMAEASGLPTLGPEDGLRQRMRQTFAERQELLKAA